MDRGFPVTSIAASAVTGAEEEGWPSATGFPWCRGCHGHMGNSCLFGEPPSSSSLPKVFLVILSTVPMFCAVHEDTHYTLGMPKFFLKITLKILLAKASCSLPPLRSQGKKQLVSPGRYSSTCSHPTLRTPAQQLNFSCLVRDNPLKKGRGSKPLAPEH